MKRTSYYRFTALMVILFVTLSSTNLHAELRGKSVDEFTHEAFLHGGSAISAALMAASEPTIPESMVPPAPPKPSMAAPAQEGKTRKVMLWVGIGVTAAIAGYLVQRSIRNHDKIFSDRATQ